MRQRIHSADAPIDGGKAILSQSWRSPGLGNAGFGWCFVGSRQSAGPVRSGDGSAMYSPQALWSAVHEETPVVFVVLNNAEYGILKDFMLSQPQYNARQYGFLAMDICNPSIDFQLLARSMGVPAQRVTSKGEISGMVEAALASGKSQLIEIPVTNA